MAGIMTSRPGRAYPRLQSPEAFAVSKAAKEKATLSPATVLNSSGQEWSIYVEARVPKMPCPFCKSTDTQFQQDNTLLCSTCKKVSGPYTPPQRRMYCPVCNDDLLSDLGITGSNNQHTFACRSCRTSFRHADDTPRGVGLVMG